MALTTKQNGKNTDAVYDNVKETFPKSTAGAGTVSTVNDGRKVVGVGTSFTTDFERGATIWFKGADELCEIENIVSDTEMTLVLAPATTATGDTYGVIKRNGYEFISWAIDAANAATINGVSYPASTSNTYERRRKKIAPILIDSTANGNIVNVSAY